MATENELSPMPSTDLSHMVQYGEVIGIFNQDRTKRLDLGPAGLKKKVSPQHNVPSSRLKFHRLDGPNQGEVSRNHKVALFSEDGYLRLEVGSHSMVSDVPADAINATTRLVCQPVRTPLSDVGIIQYGELFGVFSEDMSYRLDIGKDGMKKEQHYTRDSRDSNLVVDFPDPIIDMVEFMGLEYFLDGCSLLEETQDKHEYSGGRNKTSNQPQEIEFNITREAIFSFTFESLKCLAKPGYNTSSCPTTPRANTLSHHVRAPRVQLPYSTAKGVTLTRRARYEYAEDAPKEIVENLVHNIKEPVTLPPKSEMTISLTTHTSTVEVPYLLHAQFKFLSGAVKNQHLWGLVKCTNSYIEDVSYNFKPYSPPPGAPALVTAAADVNNYWN